MGFFSKSKKPKKETPPEEAPSAEGNPALEVEVVKSVDAPPPQPAPPQKTAAPLPPPDPQIVARLNERYALFGKLVTLMSLAPNFRGSPLSEIVSLLTPAINAGQVLIAEGVNEERREPVPAAFALWASVSESVDKRLSEHLDEPWRLEPQDWRGGDIPWLILVVGDEKVISPMLGAFMSRTIPGKDIKMRAKDSAGKNVINVLHAGPPANS